MLKLDGIYSAVGNIGFRSKGKLHDKPSYFSVGGFSIPVDIGRGKQYEFNFDWVQSYGDSTRLDDGTYQVDFTLRELDLEFINESLECSQDLSLMDIFRSIEKVEMGEIYYLWDKVLEDGSIEEDASHFFNVAYFEIDVYHMKDGGEEGYTTFKVPQELLDAYNMKTDKQWNEFDLAMNGLCVKEGAGSVLLRN